MADLVLPSTLAVWDPLGGTPEPVMTGHDGVIWHTMAGSFAGTDAYFHQNGWGGTESTVGVAGSGFCKQWVPWNRQADANLEGNARYLSIEFADAGEGFPPLSTANDESPPMTAAQLERGIRLCVYWCDVRNHRNCPSTWRCHSEGIPAVWMDDSCHRGIGVHRHGIDPWRLQWSGGRDCPEFSKSDGKICNRSVRLRQVRDDAVPAIRRRLAGTPPPIERKDPDMAVIIAAEGKGPLLIAGNEAVGLDGFSRDALRKAGVPYAVISPNIYDRARVVYKVETEPPPA